MKILKTLVAVSVLSVAGFGFAFVCPAYDNNTMLPEGYVGSYGTTATFYSVEIEPGVNRISCFYTGPDGKIAGGILNISNFATSGAGWQQMTSGWGCGTRSGGSVNDCQFTYTS